MENEVVRRIAVSSIAWLDLIRPDEKDKLRKVIPRMPLLRDDLRRWRREMRCSDGLS